MHIFRPPDFQSGIDFGHVRRMDETTNQLSPRPGGLPTLLGIERLSIAAGAVEARLEVGEPRVAPNGYLHAAGLIALTDSARGVGCLHSRPQGAAGFTTIDLKSNFLGTARQGDGVMCGARLAHGGRTTQVWDAEVRYESSGKAMALFRSTQLLLYPKPA